MRVSAIVPARNEAECIGSVVRGLLAQRDQHGEQFIAEVVVADNGSRDDTTRIAQQAGARVVYVSEPGYGRACWEAAQVATGQVLLFVDGDGAADPDEARHLLADISGGADLAIGVRLQPEPGSMSVAQRFGNRLACALMYAIWRAPSVDLGPYRAVRRSAFDTIQMRDRGFGWTVEMQVRAHLLGLVVTQRPVRWRTRIAGQSKISGTVRGVINAGIGIIGMIARLWWQERRRFMSTSGTMRSPSSSAYDRSL